MNKNTQGDPFGVPICSAFDVSELIAEAIKERRERLHVEAKRKYLEDRIKELQKELNDLPLDFYGMRLARWQNVMREYIESEAQKDANADVDARRDKTPNPSNG